MTTGIVTNIQRFSIHDGPGIRTTVFFKGCPLRCRWCQNPESLHAHPEIAFYAENCAHCYRCASACPQDAILREPTQRVDFKRCDGCGRCARVCSRDGLRQVGRLWSAPALVVEILKDRDHYDESGGGVTLSGGEPGLQAAFLEVLLPQLKTAGLHVTLQTCGLFRWKRIAPLVPLIDLVYFDLKHMDPGAHRHLTGADNQLILKNFTRLAGRRARLQPRMPVIPGHNDARADVTAVARWLKRSGFRTIHCLAYHNLGEAKRKRIHSDLTPLAVDTPVEAAMARVQSAFEHEGIHAVIVD